MEKGYICMLFLTTGSVVYYKDMLYQGWRAHSRLHNILDRNQLACQVTIEISGRSVSQLEDHYISILAFCYK